MNELMHHNQFLLQRKLKSTFEQELEQRRVWGSPHYRNLDRETTTSTKANSPQRSSSEGEQRNPGRAWALLTLLRLSIE
jgi:hypothetical protein